MKKSSTTFLKGIIILVAIITVTALIRFPLTEGRAANLNLISIYTDPFIIYIYVGSIPFFVGLYQAFKLLILVDSNNVFSQQAINVLKNIKYASLILIGFIAIAEIFIHLFAGGDDPAGPTMLGFIVSIAVAVVATAASIFQKILRNAVDLKSENDLTV